MISVIEETAHRMRKMVSEVAGSENETPELSPEEDLGPAMQSPSKEYNRQRKQM